VIHLPYSDFHILTQTFFASVHSLFIFPVLRLSNARISFS
jgi:hypothetical protein